LPLYEYRCPRCGTFEQVHKFSDPALAACPTCGGAVEKLPSAPAIQFKGSGWYITDYARKGKGDGSAKESGGEGASKDAAKDSGATKESGSKDATKESGSKDATKESGSKDSGSASAGKGSPGSPSGSK